jgi:hypothetical protein
MTDFTRDEPGTPKIVDRSTFQAELDTPLRAIFEGDGLQPVHKGRESNGFSR